MSDDKYVKHVVLDRGYRRESFSVDRGVHTFEFDLETLSKAAIADFVKKQIELRPKPKGYVKASHHEEPVDSIALAIGWFGVSVKDIYGDDVADEFDLDDDLLVKIIRYRNEREKYAEQRS